MLVQKSFDLFHLTTIQNTNTKMQKTNHTNATNPLFFYLIVFYFIQSYVTSFNAIFYHIISVKQNRAQNQHIQPLFTKKINKYPKNKIHKK